MTTMKFRQLIDMAIGFPEPGHVNFSALHCLLTCISEKLGIKDEMVDYSNNENETICSCNKGSNYNLLRKSRLFAGSNLDEGDADSEQSTTRSLPDPDATALQNTASADLPQAQDNADTSSKVQDVVSDIIEDAKSKVAQDKEEKVEQKSVIGNLSPKDSKTSTKSISLKISVEKQNERISEVDMTVQKVSIPTEFVSGITIMKDQLEFVIEQLLLLTFLTLSKKPDCQQIQTLHLMAQTLDKIKKDNSFIEGSNRLHQPVIAHLNWHSSGLQLNENLSENDVLEAQSADSPHYTIKAQTDHHEDELEGHLCYSPEKLLDQQMELKGEVCILTNKLNELSSRLLEQESQRTLSLITELQNQMRDTKQTNLNLKETQTHMELRLTRTMSNIENIKKNIEEIFAEKVDKTQLEIQLADKIDYSQLQRKVSLDQILELQCRIDKKFCEVLRQINESEKKFSQTVDNLKDTLGLAAIDRIFKTFKENVDKDIRSLQELIHNYIESTNDDCAAAGARIKILKDLACLSCDTNCVMRTVEKSKVAKLPSAQASNILSPLITYELGSIRKSGIIGYYRKDEFPHATHAWLARQSNSLNGPSQCVPRHAGGQHTTNNARERFKKKSHAK